MVASVFQEIPPMPDARVPLVDDTGRMATEWVQFFFRFVTAVNNGTYTYFATNLPVADPHVVGQLYNASGVVKVSAG